MNSELKITKAANDTAKGMTVGELDEFVQEVKASSIGPDAHVKVRIGYSGQIKSVSAGHAR